MIACIGLISHDDEGVLYVWTRIRTFGIGRVGHQSIKINAISYLYPEVWDQITWASELLSAVDEWAHEAKRAPFTLEEEKLAHWD